MRVCVQLKAKTAEFRGRLTRREMLADVQASASSALSAISELHPFLREFGLVGWCLMCLVDSIGVLEPRSRGSPMNRWRAAVRHCLSSGWFVDASFANCSTSLGLADVDHVRVSVYPCRRSSSLSVLAPGVFAMVLDCWCARQ